MQECTICLLDINLKKIIQCNHCDTWVCKDCLLQCASINCSNCKMQLSILNMNEKFGKLYTLKLSKIHHDTIYFNRESELFGPTQEYVNWTKIVDEAKKKKIYSNYIKIPPKPSNFIKNNNYFPCQVQDCRGFISNNKCGVCSIIVCGKCKEVNKNPKTHICDPHILESLATISKESKQCPKCNVTIIRSHGCNHMFCTNCCTHFDYVTGKSYYRPDASYTNGYQKKDIFGVRRTESPCNEDALFDKLSYTVTMKENWPMDIKTLLFKDFDLI